MSRISTQNNDLEAAETFIKSIPASSPGRMDEELRIGQIYWFDYLRKSRGANAEKRESLKSIRDKAKSYLQPNMARLELTKTLSPENARATLSLTDLYLDEGDAKAALEQLENATVAPIDLIKQKHAAATSEKFVTDTNKTAIRVYIAMMRVDKDASKWIGKAKGVLGGLEESLKASDPANAEAKLRNVYIQLAKESKTHMDRMTSLQKKIEFSTSLLTLLDSIQNGTSSIQTLLWAGQTLNELGESLSSAGDPDSAKRLHEKAIVVFDKARKIGFGNDPNAARLMAGLERQAAVALRGTGKFEAALKKFADLLEQKAFLDIQMEAAMTYQLQAESPKTEWR